MSTGPNPKQLRQAAIRKACETAGSQVKLAKKLGLRSPSTIGYWLKVGRVPERWIPKLEKLTHVPRHELRGEAA